MGFKITDFGQRRDAARGPELALTGAAGLAAATVLLAAWKLPVALILPAVSLVLLAAGFALALIVWKGAVSRHRLSYRDVAAMLVFFGFGAALLSDLSALAPLFDRAGR
jgi:hypothetical protein